MKIIATITALLLITGPIDIALASGPIRAIIRVQVSEERSSRSQTVIFKLEEGVEKNFGNDYPMLKVLVLNWESDQLPLRISLVAENGQTLNSTIVYFTPESGAEFSLDADGIDAQGEITALEKR